MTSPADKTASPAMPVTNQRAPLIIPVESQIRVAEERQALLNGEAPIS